MYPKVIRYATAGFAIPLGEGKGLENTRTSSQNPIDRTHSAPFSVTHLAMEATGVYWKPVWNILEGEFEVMLVNTQHIKRVPGRKTDVKDCEWIAELLQHGLVQASFVPPPRCVSCGT